MARAPVSWRNVPGKDEITLASLRKSIPPEFFQRSTTESLAHTAFDLLTVWATYVLAQALLGVGVPAWCVYPAYIIAQGFNLTALWVLGHECGHGGFTDHKWLNDLVGLGLHTFCGTPYYAWAASHAKHHRHTNDMHGGESWVPDVLPAGGQLSLEHRLTRTPLGAAVRGVLIFLTGFHAYLWLNITGEGKNFGMNHYFARKPLFNPAKLATKFAVNNALLLAWYSYVASLVLRQGFGSTFVWFIGPHMVNMGMLTTITFMQHTHPNIPHFGNPDWNWLRGAISTIDRSMGAFMDWRLHRIVDSHVVHHLFSDMPFYNAIKATPYVKKALGKYYKASQVKVLGSSFVGYWSEYFRLMASTQVVQKQEKDGLYWFLDETAADHEDWVVVPKTSGVGG